MKLIVTILARRDLNGISRFTLDNWGRSQLDVYLSGLLDRLDEVALNRGLGRNIAKIPQQYLRVKYRSHFIFFRVVGDEVRIIRILHQRMDAARHLN